VACGKKELLRFYTHWECQSCGHRYLCVRGIPKLYIEEYVGEADKRLRDRLYNNLLGRFYNFMMPFLSLPVRPLNVSFQLWGIYFLVLFYLGILLSHIMRWAISRQFDGSSWIDGLVLLLILGSIIFFRQYPYIWNLMMLAIPVKMSLSIRKFQPQKSFQDIHKDFQEEYRSLTRKIRMLDIATGSCNSLYRHGWMGLNAEFAGVDLSEQMLLKGADFMTRMNVGIDFAFADAQQLPFETESFDIVTCYGAVNGFTSISKALNEMVRVTKKGGKILFLDEQLYAGARFFERLYFDSVLSSHDIVKRCPVEMLPINVEQVEVYQVYQFYYICIARKGHDR
jgi:ubiquinone/menaquinone biosynthesis C-methylase UbiE